MILESQLPRRRVLQLGGIVALSPLLTDFVASRPAAAAGFAGSAFRAAGAPVTVPDLSPKSLWYRLPATDWQSQALPIGNARLGAMLYGAPEEEVVQFNEQSLWGGVNNYDNALMGQPDGAFDTGMLGFGSYRDFGALRITFAARPKVASPGGPYQISGSETLEKTYDGNAGTKWCIIAPPASVQWQAQLPEATVVSSYTLTSANDVPARDPQDWVFAGSVDGSTWVTLDTRHIAPFEQRLQAKQFAFANTDAYRYYRFVFTPKPGVSHFQVGEVALGGVSLASGSTVYVSSPSGHAAGASAGSDITRSVDNDAATVWRVDEPGDGVQWQLDLPSAHAMTSYRLQAGPDSPEHDPRGWVLEATANGRDWTTLDTRSGGSPFAARGEEKRFTFANSTPYSSYRLTFTTASPTTPLQLARIAFASASTDTGTRAAVAEYRRALDPAIGLHATSYATVAGRVLREAFASRGADVIVLRYTTDAAAGMSAELSLTSAQENAPTSAHGDGRGLGFASAMGNGLKHAASVRVVDADGDISASGGMLRIAGATRLTLVLDARTDYKMSAADGWRGAAPQPRIDAAISAAADRSYDDLFAEHVDEVSELTSRAAIEWGDTDAGVLKLSTSERLARYATGAADPMLEQAMYDYGRYLLISSSKPGGLPANLQGLWNNSNQPAWASDYHTNINVQMNYWSAETTDLPESHEALAAFIEQVAVPEPRGDEERVRPGHARLDGPHVAEHLRRQLVGVEHDRERLVRAAPLRALGVHAGPEVPREPRVPAHQGDLPVLGARAQGAARRHPRRAERLVARARPARRRRHARPADHLGPVPELPRVRRGARRRRRVPRDHRRPAVATRAEQDRKLGSAAGVADRPRRPERPAPPHVAPVRGLPGAADHGVDARAAGRRARLAEGTLRREGGRAVHPGHGVGRQPPVVDLAVAHGPVRAARRCRAGEGHGSRACSPTTPCRTCSATTRRSSSTATSASPARSPRCCCRATAASSTCCPPCRPTGRRPARSRACAPAAATRSAASGATDGSRRTTCAPTAHRT